MGNVVAFPPRSPDWLYFVADRLMVRADKPLDGLHAFARQLGMTRAQYFLGNGKAGALPYYLVPQRLVDTLNARVGEDCPTAAGLACYRARTRPPSASECGA
jgi:hypothetical protein